MYTVKCNNKDNENGLAKGIWYAHEFSKKKDAKEWAKEMQRLHPEVECDVDKIGG